MNRECKSQLKATLHGSWGNPVYSEMCPSTECKEEKQTPISSKILPKIQGTPSQNKIHASRKKLESLGIKCSNPERYSYDKLENVSQISPASGADQNAAISNTKNSSPSDLDAYVINTNASPQNTNQSFSTSDPNAAAMDTNASPQNGNIIQDADANSTQMPVTSTTSQYRTPSGYKLAEMNQLTLLISRAAVCKDCQEGQLILMEDISQRAGWNSKLQLKCSKKC